jgi:hypothetical protein
MNDMLSPNKMVEATRLTRAGRLTEATALLQRMLRAESPRDMTVGTEVDIVPTGGSPQSLTRWLILSPRRRIVRRLHASASKVARRAGRSQARPRPLSGTCSLG